MALNLIRNCHQLHLFLGAYPQALAEPILMHF